ncbi:MAG: hypothetical protein BWY82_00934 [Verrucomicrobia bacterium ADurb.Bin474]|nr:MAG: hypothetical protein BWY82_00934 [Verrucomicrobia bacterium ADurb.Bin474]
MLHHNQGISLVAQTNQRVDQTLVIARMQPDGGFIEHVEHTGQVRAKLRRQTDALGLATRKRKGLAIQRQVFDPHLLHECQALDYLGIDIGHDRPPAIIQRHILQAGEEIARIQTEQLGKRRIGSIYERQTDIPADGVESIPVAIRAYTAIRQ